MALEQKLQREEQKRQGELLAGQQGTLAGLQATLERVVASLDRIEVGANMITCHWASTDALLGPAPPEPHYLAPSCMQGRTQPLVSVQQPPPLQPTVRRRPRRIP